MLRVSYLNSGWHTVIHITVFLARGELLAVVLAPPPQWSCVVVKLVCRFICLLQRLIIPVFAGSGPAILRPQVGVSLATAASPGPRSIFKSLPVISAIADLNSGTQTSIGIRLWKL